MEKFVTIIGGYGGMGQIFTKLFIQENCRVTICGPNERNGSQVAKDLGAIYEKDNIKGIKDADVVIITVPIEVTAQTITHVAPHVKSGALICDLTSVKVEPCQLMLKHSSEDVEVVGTHPIFGPRVGSVDGQVFVVTPIRGTKWLAWLVEILERHNARIVESTPDEHDSVMAVVQGLTHFAYISFGKTLKDLSFDVRRSRNFSSPVYDLMLDMVGRIIGQNPWLYAEIQMQNPKIPQIHDAFIDAAKSLSRQVKEKDEKGFVEAMAEAAKNFDDTERAMGRSDKAISSLVNELHILKDSIGKRMILKHIYSGVNHSGVVKEVSPDELVLEDGGKISRLKLSNLRILPDSELIDYKVEKYGIVTRDFSVILTESAEEEFIGQIISNFSDDILKVEVKDIYRGDGIAEDRKSVCFGLELVAEDVKSLEQMIRKNIKRMGIKQR